VVIDQKQLYLIFEYLDKDLRAYMESLGTKMMEPLKVKKFLYQMLAGIADCHMKRIIHRDLKPANILLDASGNTFTMQITSRSRILALLGHTPSPFVPTPRKW
jgi:serine/threonine protein kinase